MSTDNSRMCVVNREQRRMEAAARVECEVKETLENVQNAGGDDSEQREKPATQKGGW